MQVIKTNQPATLGDLIHWEVNSTFTTEDGVLLAGSGGSRVVPQFAVISRVTASKKLQQIDFAGTGGAERMPDRHRAAHWIDAIPVEVTHLGRDAGLLSDPIRIVDGCDIGQDLCREGFVDLPKGNVGECQLMSREQTRNGI